MATPEEGYLWSDGSTEAKTFAWSIATAKLTITAKNISKVYGEDDPELTVNAVIIRFVDVREGRYYYDPVYWAVAKGIAVGTSETTFSPRLTATRAEVITFLWRMVGRPEPETTDCAFEDVPEVAYYRKAVLWAYENGITVGINRNTFGSNKICTREQFITFLWNVDGKPEPAITEIPFEDVKPGYSYKAILWAYENGITAGTSQNTFDRKAGCTRAQAVTFLYRYCESGN